VTFDPDSYDARFEKLERSGQYLHGEVDLVESYRPSCVLDAGCGTGRVAIELTRRGIGVVGVDIDWRMLDQARAKAPHLTWYHDDLATCDLTADGPFCAVVMAGNVLIFTKPGTEEAVIANMARHLRPGGHLIAGFQLRPDRIALPEYDAFAGRAGLGLVDRWSTWDRRPFAGDGDYAVSVHTRRS
jgi:SAM-dependent methyltransferase